MTLNASRLREMFLSAAGQLEADKELINGLNVFPVPDGDTGSNMSMTMSGIRGVELIPSDGIGDFAGKAASKLLRSARGNSGVILSLFVKGFAKGMSHLSEADLGDLAVCFRSGVDCAYKSVMNPMEGTVLTVMRRTTEAAEKAVDNFVGDLPAFLRVLLSAAEDALAETPEILPVLKNAGVVDAGGRGFVSILYGFIAAAEGHPIQFSESVGSSYEKADFSSFETENITFPYCTECIVEKRDRFLGEGKAESMREFLSRIGDSIVFVDDEEIIKLHVHTSDPGRVLSQAIEYGALATVKVENMRKQHTALADNQNAVETARPTAFPAKPYGFVAVASGKGIADSFRDLGVDVIVEGGQTMNPSMGDILTAISEVNAEVVYVLPNNSNIYLAAQQAAKDVSDKTVYVIPCKSVCQGIGAMLAFDEGNGSDTNFKNMKNAVKNVHSYSVTYSERNSVYAGKQIKRGQILGLCENKVCEVTDDRASCISKLLPYLKNSSFITIFYGADVPEDEANRTLHTITAAVPNADITILNGGQPVYSYLIGAE